MDLKLLPIRMWILYNLRVYILLGFKPMRIPVLFFILTFSLPFTACTIHRIDIQQGNVITTDMVDELKIGMTKRQVRFVMGTPMLQDPFHPQRWDYIFTLQPGDTRKITESVRVTVYFKQDELIKIDKEGI